MPRKGENMAPNRYGVPTNAPNTSKAAARTSINDDLRQAYGTYKANQRMGTVSQLTPDAIAGDLQNAKNQLSQQPKPFSFDINSDPQYQAALRQAQANSQRAAGDIAADMNKRGLLNSTITADRSNQAAQREYGYVSDTLVPKLYDQAYNRHTTKQQNQRQRLLDYLDVTGKQYDLMSGERTYNDTRADLAKAEEEKARQGRLDLANSLSEKYGIVVQPKMDAKLVYDQVEGLTPVAEREARLEQLWDVATETGTFPDELAAMYNLPRGTRTLDAEKVGIQRYTAESGRISANASAKNAATSASRESRIASTPKSSGGKTSTSYKTDPGFEADYAFVLQNPLDARADLEANPAAWIELYGVDGYKQLISALPELEEEEE